MAGLRPKAVLLLHALAREPGQPVCGVSLRHPKSVGPSVAERAYELRKAIEPLGWTTQRVVCECVTRCRPRRDADQRAGRPRSVKWAWRLIRLEGSLDA